jgi:hypothetical protein
MSIENIRPQLEQFLFQGNKVEAIKLYREAAGCELLEAKKAVEAMERVLRKDRPGSFTTRPSNGDAFKILLIAMALGALAYVLLKD